GESRRPPEPSRALRPPPRSKPTSASSPCQRTRSPARSDTSLPFLQAHASNKRVDGIPRLPCLRAHSQAQTNALALAHLGQKDVCSARFRLQPGALEIPIVAGRRDHLKLAAMSL